MKLFKFDFSYLFYLIFIKLLYFIDTNVLIVKEVNEREEEVISFSL